MSAGDKSDRPGVQSQGDENRIETLPGPFADVPDEEPGYIAKSINSAKLGVDSKGFFHHYWRNADAITVYNEDGVDTYQYLRGDRLIKWIKFIDEKRGWMSAAQMSNGLIWADTWRKR